MIKLLIDGVEFEEVDGLKKAKINIVRDNNIRGLLIKFMSDVTFYGAAYDAIVDYAETNGGCANIPINAYYGDEGGDGYSYSGYIVYKDPDTKIDISKKHITCKIQQGDLSSYIIDKISYLYTINSPTCIDGVTALTQITNRATSYFTNGGGLTFNGPYETYLIKDVLSQCLEYLSNGSVSLNAPIFDVAHVQDGYDIDFNNWVSGETMTLEWTNYYGQVFRAQQTYSTTETNSVNQLSYRCIHEYDGAQTQADVTQYLQKWSTADRNPSTELELRSLLPFSDVTVTVDPSRGGINEPIVTKVSTFVFGLQGLAITKESYLGGQTTQFRVSLGQILIHLTQVFNLTFSFQENSSGLEMLLQPLEDYFSNTEAIDLGNMVQVDSEFSDDFAITQINTPSGVNANVFNATSWNTDLCIGGETAIEADGFSSQDFYNAFTKTEVSEKILWAILDIDGGYTQAKRYAYNVVNNSGGIVVSFRYSYNAPYFSALRCLNYSINSNLDFTQTIKAQPYLRGTCISNCNNGVITNDNTLLIDTKYNFDGRLTQEQVIELTSTPTQFIKFAIRGVEYNGFINEISIEPYTNNATLSLLAENIKQ